MSMKKNVAIVEGKASHVPSTPSTLSSPPVEEQVEVKLDDKMVTKFLSDAKFFDRWKDLADAGDMVVRYGIKDAAHLEDVINKQGREVILSAKIASAKAELEATTSAIRDVLDDYFDDTMRKDVFGQIDFHYDHKNSVWSFSARVNHRDLPKQKRNGNGNGKQKKQGIILFDTLSQRINKRTKCDACYNKKRPVWKRNSTAGVVFICKDCKPPILYNSGKKKNLLDRRLPGHYGANQ